MSKLLMIALILFGICSCKPHDSMLPIPAEKERLYIEHAFIENEA